MIKTCLLLFLLLPFYSQGQGGLSVGEGVLKIDFEKQRALEFFTDTLQAVPAQTLSVVTDPKGELIIQHKEGTGSWFMPEQLFLEYGIFVLRVEIVAGNWYKVFVNNKTAAALWVKADQTRQFVNWPAFLLKETTAIDMASVVLDIKTAPLETAKTIKKMEQKDCFEVLEIKGDWMKIRTNTGLECNESKKPVKLGWIRWRHKNRLMISYALSC